MKIKLTILLLLIPVTLLAQEISVEKFYLAESDQTANTFGTEAFDQNGNRCALIRIATTEKGFTFEGGSLGITKVDDNHDAEVWVYVPAGLRRITIHHPKLGNLYNYEFPISLQSGRTYIMHLIIGMVHTVVEEDAGGQFLIMHVQPTNATVYVDEQQKSIGNDGVVSQKLPYGKHTYRVEAVGFLSESGIVEIGREKVEKYVELKSSKATLTVTCPTQDAQILINGEFKGNGGCTVTLLPGNYILEARKTRYRTQKQTISLAVQKKKKIELSALEPLFGTITISCPMSDAQIYVNEQYKGTGKVTCDLDAGTYDIEARKQSHRAGKQTITINEKDNKSITVPVPEPIYGTLELESNPVGAEVWLDGKKLGTTPDIFHNILVGSHELELRKQGYKTAKRTITISEAKMESVSMTLEKGYSGDGETFTVNGVTFKMIPVQGGTFTMGCTSEQGHDCESDESPAHSVTLSDYYIGDTEVTQELWHAVMGSNPSNFKGTSNPVEMVSWYDCQEFITRLNQLTGRNFRLPTEAEWEYAARGVRKIHGYKYSGSNSLGNAAWYSDNSGHKTHPVKTKSPNELGIYDMSGNVYEWCHDWYDNYSGGPQTNPKGPSTGSYRVLRGGSWYNNARNCRVSYRDSGTPGYRSNLLGFRLAL